MKAISYTLSPYVLKYLLRIRVRNRYNSIESVLYSFVMLLMNRCLLNSLGYSYIFYLLIHVMYLSVYLLSVTSILICRVINLFGYKITNQTIDSLYRLGPYLLESQH